LIVPLFTNGCAEMGVWMKPPVHWNDAPCKLNSTPPGPGKSWPALCEIVPAPVLWTLPLKYWVPLGATRTTLAPAFAWKVGFACVPPIVLSTSDPASELNVALLLCRTRFSGNVKLPAPPVLVIDPPELMVRNGSDPPPPWFVIAPSPSKTKELAVMALPNEMLSAPTL
jgi:hypothetical protein